MFDHDNHHKQEGYDDFMKRQKAEAEGKKPVPPAIVNPRNVHVTEVINEGLGRK